MRILHIYKDYFPVVGGIENHIRLLAEAQAARGHGVTVLVTSRTARTHLEMLSGVRVIFAARLFELASAPISLAFIQHLKRESADVTHLHSPYPLGEVANYFWGAETTATVLTYHSDIVRQRMLGALYRPLLHRILARVDAIIATSPNYVASSPVLARWKEKCVVVPLAYSQPKSDRRPPTAVCDDASEGGGRLLFVGRLRYYKGLHYLLQAMTLLPNVRLTVVGTGPMEREWKDLARALGIAERVAFVGHVADEVLPAYYAACDIFVLPCCERSEAFGVVQLEAMAAGKPVISCDVGTGVAWVNQNEVTGLVVPPRDPRALAEAIQRLVRDKALCARMGAAGQARVRAEFTVERMTDGVMQVYERACPSIAGGKSKVKG